MSWGLITDDGLANAEALIGTPLRRDRMQWIQTTSRDAIRHFAWGIGDNNPLWLDGDYGEKSIWGSALAPPCILYAVDSTIVAPKLPGVQWLYAGTDWTWYEPILCNDSFTVEAKLVRQEKKSGRRFPLWVLQSGEVRYFNQHKRLVATAMGHCARTPRGDNIGGLPVKEHKVHSYSSAELDDIENHVLAEASRGSDPLLWEDVLVGDQVPSVVRGPLAIMDLIGWYSATQGTLHYGGVHGDALRYRRRHDDYHINPATGAKEAAGRGHFEAKTGKDVGMGGAYDVGPQRISWAQHMLTNWIGDQGFLHKLNISVRSPNMVGDTIWWQGKVINKYIENRNYFVEIALKAHNQVQAPSAFGTAVVLLPSREAGLPSLPLHN
jgi:acyl dehydratase|tara:strand:- start:2661 stop:3800 length:1140 start_codon:yes stop_codon:yes gene_type:complete